VPAKLPLADKAMGAAGCFGQGHIFRVIGNSIFSANRSAAPDQCCIGTARMAAIGETQQSGLARPARGERTRHPSRRRFGGSRDLPLALREYQLICGTKIALKIEAGNSGVRQ